MFHFLKGEPELTGKVAMIMQILKFCISLFSRVVRGHLFRFLSFRFFFFQFCIFVLLAQGLSITLRIFRVHWGPFTDCPKIVSVLKPFRSKYLPVAHQGPFKLPNIVSPRGSVRSLKKLWLPGPFQTSQKSHWVPSGPLHCFL